MSEEPATGAVATLNIDDFCKDVARALIQLAQTFPRPHNLFVEDVYRAEEPDEYGLHSNRYLACFSALTWLQEEGYIRYVDTLKTEAIEQAVLTSAALVQLITPATAAAEPGNHETLALDRNTLLARMRGALKSGSSTELRWAVLELMRRMQSGA